MKRNYLLRAAVLLIALALLAGCNTQPSSTPSSTSTPAALATAAPASSQAPASSAPEQTSSILTDPNLNPPGTLPIAKERITLTVGVPQNAVIENWETNLQTLALEEDTNIDLSFVEFPSNSTEFLQKVELMIMAGGNDLPDVLLNALGGQANLIKYAQAGMIVPTTDFYQNLAYHIDQVTQKTAMTKNELLSYVTAYDGNVYGVFTVAESINNQYSRGRVMIYDPWLEALSLEAPQTTEEFVAVLTAFVQDDPNGNGKADEIGLVGFRDVMTANYAYALMSPFIYTQPEYWLAENGKIDVAFTKDEWREGLRFTKRLIDEGLLDPISFTQDQTQMTAMISPDPATVGAFVRISASNLSGTDPKREQYTIVPPLEGPTGLRQQTWVPNLPSISMVITKNCESAEAAFLLGDYMCSEKMSLWNRFGREGIEWVRPEPGDRSLFESIGYKPTLKFVSTAWGTLQNVWWAQTGPHILSSYLNDGVVATQTTGDPFKSLGRIDSQIQYANKEGAVVGLVYNEQEQEVMTELHGTILTYARESFTRFAMGDLSLDNDWEAYLAEFERMGLDKVVAATQAAYDRQQSGKNGQ